MNRIVFHTTTILSLCLLLTACIGTDFIDELIGTDLSSVTIEPRVFSVEVGKTYSLSAQYFNFSGDPASATLQWASRQPGIASVDQNGLVRGLTTGQTHIVVTANSLLRDSVLVTVVADPNAVATIEVTGSASSLKVGETLQLQAKIRNSNGAEISGKTVQWSSDAPAVASIDALGLVKALTVGRAAFTARVDGINSLPFTVDVAGSDRSGTFVGNGGYNAGGRVTVLKEGDKNIVRLESDFRTSTGPGLHVYLSRSGAASVDGVDLGSLKAVAGEQRYPIPDNIDPATYSHVLIYCQPFRVVFAYAELK